MESPVGKSGPRLQTQYSRSETPENGAMFLPSPPRQSPPQQQQQQQTLSELAAAKRVSSSVLNKTQAQAVSAPLTNVNSNNTNTNTIGANPSPPLAPLPSPPSSPALQTNQNAAASKPANQTHAANAPPARPAPSPFTPQEKEQEKEKPREKGGVIAVPASPKRDAHQRTITPANAEKQKERDRMPAPARGLPRLPSAVSNMQNQGAGADDFDSDEVSPCFGLYVMCLLNRRVRLCFDGLPVPLFSPSVSVLSLAFGRSTCFVSPVCVSLSTSMCLWS